MQVCDIMSRSVVIIGSSIAGMSAAIAAREACPQCPVTVLDEDPHMPYRRPSITSILEGTIRDIPDISMYRKAIENSRVKVLRGFKAIDIDPVNQVLKIAKPDGSKAKIYYDSLVLATGAEASKQNIEGVDLRGVFVFRNAKDALEINEYAKYSKKAIIVGASFVALLLTEALIRKGLKVLMVVRSRVLRKLIESQASDIIENYLRRIGVEILKGVTIKKIMGKRRVEGAILSDGRSIDSDMVIFAIGSIPRTALATKLGSRVIRGVIDVDNYMQTSVPNVYAAGDCAYSWDLITGNKVYAPTATIASTYGKVAGLNAAGKLMEAPKIIRIQYERFLDLEIISIGYTSDEARAMNLSAKCMDLTDEFKKEYSLWRANVIKLDVTMRGKDKVIGTEIIGLHNSRVFAYPFIYAITKGLKLSEILEELHYPIPSLSAKFTTWYVTT